MTPKSDSVQSAPAGSPMAEPTCSYCDHPKSAHRHEAGFYDVRAKDGECGYVGCPCTSFRPPVVMPTNGRSTDGPS